MEQKRKRGRPPLAETEKSENYTESFYAPKECGQTLGQLTASYGKTKGAVICAALQLAKRYPNELRALLDSQNQTSDS